MTTAPASEQQDALLLDRQLCFKLYAASRAVTRAYKPMLAQLGVTYPQYLVLLVLWEWHDQAPSAPTVKALGERLLLDSGTLTPLLKRLEQLGLVQRRRSTLDEREVHLGLTDPGRALRAQAVPLKAQLLCEYGNEVAEIDALQQRLDVLLSRLQTAHS